MTRKHQFEQVDAAPDPRQWVSVLERLHAEPFYRAYKARVRDLLGPISDGRYLEVGAGTGADAEALGAPAVALDSSLTMCQEARIRGLSSVVGTADALPFASNTMDGCWADRTFQHLKEPMRALHEMVRVLRPGGRIVTVDPDYDTQVVEHPDQALARRVLRYRADHMLRNGTLAHRMAADFAEAGLETIQVETKTIVVRDPTQLDNVLGLRTWARSAAAAGYLTGADAERWEVLYDEVVERGTFLWSVTFFITSGDKPRA
jgi:SAM-dependent methyltransferase